MKMPFELTPSRSGAGADQIYLEVAAVVITFLLAGRYFEARAKRNAGAALRALGELGAKDVSRLDARRQRAAVPDRPSCSVGDLFVVRPGEKVATDGVVVEGRSAVDQSLLTGESVAGRGRRRRRGRRRDRQRRRRLVVEATRVGADTALAQIAQLVEQRAVRARRPCSGSPTASPPSSSRS